MNVNIGSRDVYLNPDGVFRNISILNSHKICLMGNSNVMINDSDFIFVDKRDSGSGSANI